MRLNFNTIVKIVQLLYRRQKVSVGRVWKQAGERFVQYIYSRKMDRATWALVFVSLLFFLNEGQSLTLWAGKWSTMFSFFCCLFWFRETKASSISFFKIEALLKEKVPKFHKLLMTPHWVKAGGRNVGFGIKLHFITLSPVSNRLEKTTRFKNCTIFPPSGWTESLKKY